MPERGESSDRGWRYAIFFFSPAALLVPPPFSLLSHLRHRANAAAAAVAVLCLNFFPRSQTRRAFRDDELRSLHRAPAYVVLMQIHAALIWRFLLRQEKQERERGRERGGKRKRERQNEVSDISLSKGWGMRRASSHLWILRCLFCAMQNSIRHEIVGKQVVPALTLIYRERRS